MSTRDSTPAKTPRLNKKAQARVSRRRKRLMLAAVLVAAAVGAAAAWVALASPGSALNKQLHQHSHLQIIINGNPVEVPPDIGIDPALWNDHSLDEYGEMASMSPIHTHETDGTIHLELGKWHPCTLGDFFGVWGQPFDEGHLLSFTGQVSVTVNGNPDNQFRGLVLQDGQQIVISGG